MFHVKRQSRALASDCLSAAAAIGFVFIRGTANLLDDAGPLETGANSVVQALASSHGIARCAALSEHFPARSLGLGNGDRRTVAGVSGTVTTRLRSQAMRCSDSFTSLTALGYGLNRPVSRAAELDDGAFQDQTTAPR